MNKHDLDLDYMLNTLGVVWLAEAIDEETLMRITTEMEYVRDCDNKQPIKLYVRSDGGDSRCGLALANMIQLVAWQC
jgi:ATP-dependent protease ClpP protease subunit